MMKVTLISVLDHEVDMAKLEEALKRCQHEAGAKIVMASMIVLDKEDQPLAINLVLAGALTIAEALFPGKGKPR